jgi:hypothetical protein
MAGIKALILYPRQGSTNDPTRRAARRCEILRRRFVGKDLRVIDTKEDPAVLLCGA